MSKNYLSTKADQLQDMTIYTRFAYLTLACSLVIAGCSHAGSSPSSQFIPSANSFARHHAVSYKVLYSFKGGSDGEGPAATLLDVNGVLYGTTRFGGSQQGTVFSLTTTGKEKVLHRFGHGRDGAYPYTSMIDVNGKLYGTTAFGGGYCSSNGGCGTVFDILPDGKSETVLHRFGSVKHDGVQPYAALIAETLGGTIWLFGTTGWGGVSDSGTVFEMDTTGKEEWIKSFDGSNGWNPFSTLIYYPFDVDDQLWGTTSAGAYPSAPAGTAFATGVKDNVIDTFYLFGHGKDGSNPYAGLTYLKDQNLFYGTTAYGGDTSCSTSSGSGCGTVFALMGPPHRGTEAWVFQFNGKDGANPEMQLIFDGVLYGVTAYGGAYNEGTIFSIGTDGTGETVLHSFGKGRDGSYPLYSGLIDVNGTLYGTTQTGGSYGDGTVFALTP